MQNTTQHARRRSLVTILLAVVVTAITATAALAAPGGPPPKKPHPMPNANPGGPQFASGDNGSGSGSAKQINQGHGGQGAQLTSVGYGYGLVSVSFPKKETFSQLTNLSTDYTLTQGMCGGGSPRFQVDLLPPGDKNINDAISLYVYFNTATGLYGGCPTGGPQSQANVASNTSAAAWWAFGDPNVSSNTPLTYTAAEAQYGSYQLLDAQIAADTGWAQTGGSSTTGTEQVVANDWTVNGKSYFPLPH